MKLGFFLTNISKSAEAVCECSCVQAFLLHVSNFKGILRCKDAVRAG